MGLGRVTLQNIFSPCCLASPIVETSFCALNVEIIFPINTLCIFQDARTKLKTSEAMDQPISCCAFSSSGQIFAYAASYDWSKGHEFYSPQKKNVIYLRACFDDLKPRTKTN